MAEESINHKQCADCKTLKSTQEFWLNRANKDNLMVVCIICSKARRARYGQAPKGRAYQTLLRQKNRPVPATKRCPKCKTVKSSHEFYSPALTKDNLSCQCKECIREYHRSPNLKARTKILRQRPEYKKWKRRYRRQLNATEKGKMNQRQHKLKYLYGLSLFDYNALLKAQNGMCALCPATQGTRRYALFVDHDHRTGQVRGLLCSKHNIAIGLLGDNAESVLRAYEYLSKPPAVEIGVLVSGVAREWPVERQM